jgi:SepF-like predicted cell division protein (DUF552 family)
MSYSELKRNDARLIILKALNDENDGRLNEAILTMVLDTFGHRESREWVHTQIRAMKDLGAVTVIEAGTVLIASITRLGIDHVDRRAIIEGISRPSPEE